MAREPRSPAPAPARDRDRRSSTYEDRWEPPSHDQDFVFTNIDEAPSWVDRGWASFDRGPALALPAGDVYGTGPYTTITARVGDKVVYTAARGASPAKFTVIPMAGGGDESEGTMTRKMPQVSNASLEDALKTGSMSPDDLGEDAKAQVMQRTPAMRKLIEGDVEAPKPQSIGEMGIKTD